MFKLTELLKFHSKTTVKCAQLLHEQEVALQERGESTQQTNELYVLTFLIFKFFGMLILDIDKK